MYMPPYGQITKDSRRTNISLYYNNDTNGNYLLTFFDIFSDESSISNEHKYNNFHSTFSAFFITYESFNNCNQYTNLFIKDVMIQKYSKYITTFLTYYKYIDDVNMAYHICAIYIMNNLYEISIEEPLLGTLKDIYDKPSIIGLNNIKILQCLLLLEILIHGSCKYKNVLVYINNCNIEKFYDSIETVYELQVNIRNGRVKFSDISRRMTEKVEDILNINIFFNFLICQNIISNENNINDIINDKGVMKIKKIMDWTLKIFQNEK